MKLQKTNRRWFRVGLAACGLAALLTFIPTEFGSQAGSTPRPKSAFPITRSEEPGLENYDIRQDQNEEAKQYRDMSRSSLRMSADRVAKTRKDFHEGETQLRQSVPTLTVEYNEDIVIPEVISPDVNSTATLTGPSNGIKNAEVLRNFVRQNNSLIGVNDVQANQLRVTADYTNPNGDLSFAHLEQFINDVPVFRGEIKAGFNRQGEMFKVINNLAPGLDYGSLRTDFGDPVAAVTAAFTKVSRPMTAEDTTRNAAESNNLKTVFGGGDWATTAEKMYFPTEPGVAIAAWRVMIWQPVNAYYVIVDAHTGTMLWRKNLGNDQAQSATYQIYGAPTSWLGVAGNPAPLSPASIDPGAGTQGAIGTRSNSTLIGNEAPNPGQNNLGWITDATNITDGNNVEAGLDLVTPNGVDAGSQATGSPNRTFTSLWNPPPGSPAPGDAPTAAEARRGAVIQMFYVMNKYHDALYSFGFTEAARNFQNDNFGRGGVAGDRVSAEGQDSSGTNNANFNAGADGTRGRMQMFLWTGPSPQRDGTGDAEVIIHEVTHGTSQRLHNNNAGLTANMSGGMGEGWGDFFGHTMLARSTEPLDSTNTTGGYVLLNGFGTVGTANYYYGIRRFPKARMSFTGGPMNRPHNPMTFADIDSTQINVTNGAYPAMTGPHISTTADQVHAAGEIWSSALWEVRCLMVDRLGFDLGSTKVMQYVTDGMKLDPVNPTFLQSRNSIIQSATNSADSASVGDIREGFRIRGMGFSATIQSGNGSPARVTEAFDRANVVVVDPFAVSDAPGDNDGFPEPGENLLLNVTILNNSGTALTGVTANVTGGGSVNIGNLANGASQAVQIPYTVPGAAACGSLHNVTINANSTEVPAFNSAVKSFRLGAPVGGAPVSFTNSTPIDMPAGQPTTTSGPASPYPSNITVSGVTGNKIMRITFNGFHHEFEDDLDFLLVGPGGQKMLIMSDNGGTTEQLTPITFSLADNGALLLPDATAFVDGTTYRPSNVGISNTDDQFNAPAPAPPYENPAPAGTATFASVFGTAGAALNGTWSLYIDDDVGQDPGRMDGGWTITFESNDYVCQTTSKVRADFDGDFKTDVSVFRGGTTWYANRSTAGFLAQSFGASGDVAVPGDYDFDGKTDIAVFRGGTTWFILQSSTNTVVAQSWGASGDIPVAADYEGDGKVDLAVYRPSSNDFFVRYSSGIPDKFLHWGLSGDIPVAGDFSGDGKADFTVFRPSTGTWHTVTTAVPAVYSATVFGLSGDTLVPADYDGDQKVDYAVFRSGTWHILKSSGGSTSAAFGLATDTPVPGDYDGDGKYDLAVYRGGSWFIQGSLSGPLFQSFGIAGDVPVPARYIP